jgi:hypothetical protein
MLASPAEKPKAASVCPTLCYAMLRTLCCTSSMSCHQSCHPVSYILHLSLPSHLTHPCSPTIQPIHPIQPHLIRFILSHYAARSSNSLILNIITTSPIVTITKSANPNHPNIIAVAPTPLFTLPFPKSRAICAAATEAVCCQRTET